MNKIIVSLFVFIISCAPFTAHATLVDVNGTIADTSNNLVWLKNANCFGAQTVNNAISSSASLADGQCGLTDGSIIGDWHFPTIEELRTIPIDTATGFQNIQGVYGTSSPYPPFDFSKNYWHKESATGIAWYHVVTTPTFVLPVRVWVPDLSLLPAASTFPTTGIGFQSSPITFSIQNASKGTITISTTALTGTDAVQFSVTTGGAKPCVSLVPTLNAGDSCTFNVIFAPTNTGVKSATLQVTSNAATTPILQSTLTGTGVVPIDGVCGTSDKQVLTTGPSSASGICTVGTPTAVSGSGPWNWSCNGQYGGINANCSANIQTYNIGFTSGGNGTLTGAVNQAVNYNASATAVTAIPATGYHLVNWTGTGGFVTTTSNPLTIANVTSAKTITANFAIDTLIVNFISGGNGTLTGTANQTVNYGSDTTAVTAVPATGYHFVNWTGYHFANGTGIGGFVTTIANPLTVANVTAPDLIIANFAIDSFAVNFISSGNGTLTGAASQTVNYTASTTAVTAVPTTGYHFVNWTGTGGFVTTTANPLTVANVTSVKTITANFAINTFAVNFASDSNGTLTGATNQTVNYGSDATAVTAVPTTGYHFVNWTGTGSFVTTTINPLTVTNITAAQTITANFVNDPTNGTCGSSNGTAFRLAPTVNLCSAGAESSVTNTSAWNWSCVGLNSGMTATCSAAIDITGPTLTISTLAKNSITNNPTLNISGSVSDTNGITGLTVNNVSVTITNGGFSYAFALQAGSNVIITTATDIPGNQTTDTRTITLDQTAPTLTVSSPTDNSKTAQPLATITGTIDETSTVTVNVNSGAPQSAAITGTAYSATANLTSGLNTITITATDLTTNTSSAVRTVTYDNSNPSLSITNPNQDITTALNSVTISGTVSDTITTAVVTITADGQTYPPAVAQDGSFTQNILLPTDKTYAVVATATDQAGNSTTVQRNIIKATPLTQPTIIDALKVLQAVVGITPLTASEQIRFDVAPFAINGAPLGNGIIDSADIIAILRRSIGIGSW